MMMIKLPRPYAAVLRRLHHLEKEARLLAENGLSDSRRNQLIRQFKTLIRSLHRSVHTKWWLRTAVCIAIYLQISLTDVTGQQFADPIINPFGLQNVGESILYKSVDIDDDGDQDILGIGYDTLHELRPQFYQNTGDPSNNQFAQPVEDFFGLDLSTLPEAACLFTFGDMDGDGDFDLFACVDYLYDTVQTTYNQVFAYFENTGSKTAPVFGLPQMFSLSSYVDVSLGTAVLKDIDDDGDLDLFSDAWVYAESAPYGYIYGFKLVYYENTGTPQNFEFANGVLHPFQIAGLGSLDLLLHDFGDLDADGDLDLLTASYSVFGGLTNFTYQENIGSGSAPDFGTEVGSPFQLPVNTVWSHFLQLVDFDQDGDMDLLTTAYNFQTYQTAVFYFENLQTSHVFDLTRNGAILTLSPNPASDYLHVGLENYTVQPDSRLQVINTDGRILYDRQIAQMPEQVEVGQLLPGYYQLRLVAKDGQISVPFIKVEN